jgi:CRISPR-associated endonuclease Csn1
MYKKDFRLGIDMGSTSLGWCMLELNEHNEPCNVIKMGVRIFSDGRKAKNLEPLSVTRRSYRSQRRNLDRYLYRIRNLVQFFMEEGFLPIEKEVRDKFFTIDPYEIRVKALDEKIELPELARAIIHLAKRRGYKSNRKTDKDDKDNKDKKNSYTEAINNLKENLEATQARTLGEYLWQKNVDLPEKKQHFKKPLKFRYDKKETDDEIMLVQKKFHPTLTEEIIAKIRHTIFFQFPLQPQKVGKCQLLPEFERCPKAHPLFQEFRLRQNINNLKLIDISDNSVHELSAEQKNLLFDFAKTKANAALKNMRKKILAKEADNFIFNFESEARKDFQGDLTFCEFHKDKNKQLAPIWDNADLKKKELIIEAINGDTSDEIAISKLITLGISQEIAEELINVNLPDGHGNLSKEALEKLLPAMRNGEIYAKACELNGLKFSDDYNGEIYDEGNLPYYGELLRKETLELARKSGDTNADEFGKINNPSVHIALNQLQKMVNAITKQYGAPKQIVLELGKSIKLSTEQIKDLNNKNLKNQKYNEKIAEMLEKAGIENNYENRLKVKLWEELDQDPLNRRCIYSGKQINFTELFSPKYEIEHILPKSKTFDDSIANKTISYYIANKYKGERSPEEAFGNSKDGYDWNQISARSQHLPNNKKWRFLADAMDKFNDENEVIARLLNDTRYMARVAAKYMYYVCGKDNVWTVTGKHTAMLRGKWGLNSILGDDDNKDRSDHRHHSIDAFVIALTSRSFVKQLANTIKNSRDRFIEKLAPPYPDFDYDNFKNTVHSIVVSHKPDQINSKTLQKRNQTTGPLLQEQAYSYLGPNPENKNQNLYLIRKKIQKLTLKDVENIYSPEWREKISSISDLCNDEKEFKEKLNELAKIRNIKKLKMIEPKDPQTMIPIKNKEGKIHKYQASGENAYAEIYLPRPQEPNCKWEMEVVNSFFANQPDFIPQWKKDYPKGKKIMRLYKNDIVALDTSINNRKLLRVRKIRISGIYIRDLNISQKDDDKGEFYSVRQLHLKRACKAGVDILGRFFDPKAGKENANAGNQ